jgi:hypothetical protein
LDSLFAEIIQVWIAVFVNLFLSAAVDLHVVFQALFIRKLGIADFAFEGFCLDIDNDAFYDISPDD